jgi:hypothetical protein
MVTHLDILACSWYLVGDVSPMSGEHKSIGREIDSQQSNTNLRTSANIEVGHEYCWIASGASDGQVFFEDGMLVVPRSHYRIGVEAKGIEVSDGRRVWLIEGVEITTPDGL